MASTNAEEKMIVSRIESSLVEIAANLEILDHRTKEQRHAKSVLALEITRISGEGGLVDDLKEAFGQ